MMSRSATLFRMSMPDHVCPWGLKTRHLLRSRGFDVDDRLLRSPEEVRAFKQEHGVETTPQVWIDDERVGGYEAARRHLGLATRDPEAKTYRPVVALFAVALALASATAWSSRGALDMAVVPTFAAIAMTLLALQKLKDVAAFSTMFLNYDLLAQRWVPYGYVYPFAEAAAGVLMLAGLLPFVAGSVAIVIGGIGGASVFKAVYIDRRELECACVGSGSNVPLGAVSLLENVMMFGMGVWTIARAAST